MKTITITNALSSEIKERHSETKDIIAKGMDQDQDGTNYMDASDGYHTFTELYEHRIILYMKLCEMWIQAKPSYDSRNVWASLFHSDGTCFEGWFVLGIGKVAGNQITYHIPMKYWPNVKRFSEILDKAPEFDGHKPNEVLMRINDLLK